MITGQRRVVFWLLCQCFFYVTAPEGKLTALLKRAKYESLLSISSVVNCHRPAAQFFSASYVKHKHLINAFSAVISGQ